MAALIAIGVFIAAIFILNVVEFGRPDYGFAADANELERCFTEGALATIEYEDESGKLYRNGIGVLQDYDEAGRWIETAANRGDPEGMLELGRLYREGVVFKRDPVLAYVWFNRAAAALNMSAVWERDEIGRQLDPVQLKEAQDKSAAPLLADAEWLQNLDHARRMPAALCPEAGEHFKGRAI